MFDDFAAVSNYGKLSAQFHVGRSRLIEMVTFILFFFYFLLKQLLNVFSNTQVTCFLQKTTESVPF